MLKMIVVINAGTIIFDVSNRIFNFRGKLTCFIFLSQKITELSRRMAFLWVN